MRAATGTIPQLHQATAVPVRTLQRWARQGLITRVGTSQPPRYDARQVERLKTRRSYDAAPGTATRLHGPRARAAAGTAAQLHQVTGIPVSTINLYARDGDLEPVGRVRVGRRWAATYDGEQLMRVNAARLATRRNRKCSR